LFDKNYEQNVLLMVKQCYGYFITLPGSLPNFSLLRFKFGQVGITLAD